MIPLYAGENQCYLNGIVRALYATVHARLQGDNSPVAQQLRELFTTMAGNWNEREPLNTFPVVQAIINAGIQDFERGLAGDPVELFFQIWQQMEIGDKRLFHIVRMQNLHCGRCNINTALELVPQPCVNAGSEPGIAGYVIGGVANSTMP